MLDRGCAADISYPIDLSVELIDEARPGRRVEARVEFESRVRLENVSIRVIPTAGLGLRTPAQTNVGLLVRGQRNSHSLQVDLPQDTKRRTVEVTVEGYTDGHKLSRSAILNLLPGGGESFRIVNTADGRRIREVPAKRVN